MVDSKLLERLRKADPATYDLWKKMHRQMSEGSAMSDAWLQHVLQDAIQAKGMWLKQSQDCTGKLYIAEIGQIEEDWDGTWKAEGDSPAEALLRAYLAAIECV